MNKLNIPIQDVGKWGSQTGDLIYHAVSKLGTFEMEYQVGPKRIVIKNSSDLKFIDVQRALFHPDRISEYKGWYPNVKRKEGDIVILLKGHMGKKAWEIIPPPNPQDVVPGYNSPGYRKLIRSLNPREKEALLKELENLPPEKAAEFAIGIHSQRVLSFTKNSRRENIVLALKALELGLLSIEQTASLHILDAAVSDLLTHRIIFELQQISEKKKKYTAQFLPSEYISIRKFYFNQIKKIKVPNKVQEPAAEIKPILQKFFHLSESQWENFCSIMITKEESEQYFRTLAVRKSLLWSKIVKKIQEFLLFFKELELFICSEEGLFYENTMVIPSFSMLQAVLDVKAKDLGRKSVQLVPTYGQLNEDDYARAKIMGMIPVWFYFPEKDDKLRYHPKNPEFKSMVDGHKLEGPYAKIIHDFYHAMRELCMSENVAEARFRLAGLLPKDHPLHNLLIDGELIISYPQMMEKPDHFGKIFKLHHIKERLDPETHIRLIKDMVFHSQEWRELFDLGHDDLCATERKIFTIYSIILEKMFG